MPTWNASVEGTSAAIKMGTNVLDADLSLAARFGNDQNYPRH